jgi:hypothetical protein
MGTVAGVFSDHFIISDGGANYTVRFTAGTSFHRIESCVGRGSLGGSSRPSIRPDQIAVNDRVLIIGRLDEAAKLITAKDITRSEPGTSIHGGAMADHGKTWLMGKVTAIEGPRITIRDNGTNETVSNKDTVFQRGLDPVTLADIQVGDMLLINGSVTEGTFVATKVTAVPKPKPCPSTPVQSH